MPIISGGNIISGGKITEGSGTNRIFEGTAAPTNGTSGTFAGVAPANALYRNRTDGVVYKNNGTQASPTWVAGTFV